MRSCVCRLRDTLDLFKVFAIFIFVIQRAMFGYQNSAFLEMFL